MQVDQLSGDIRIPSLAARRRTPPIWAQFRERRCDMRLIGLLCAGLLLNGSADAQGPGGGVRIGILNDQSGPYADFGGRRRGSPTRIARRPAFTGR